MEKKILSIVIGVLIAVLAWNWTTTFSKLVSIENELNKVQVELAKIQATIVDRDEIKEIVADELAKRGIR